VLQPEVRESPATVSLCRRYWITAAQTVLTRRVQSVQRIKARRLPRRHRVKITCRLPDRGSDMLESRLSLLAPKTDSCCNRTPTSVAKLFRLQFLPFGTYRRISMSLAIHVFTLFIRVCPFSHPPLPVLELRGKRARPRQFCSRPPRFLDNLD